MNQDNYVTQPVAQKLVDAGIVLETDAVWVKWYFGRSILTCRDPFEWRLMYKELTLDGSETIPAPSFAEIWRELPSGTRVINRDIKTQVYINYADKDDIFNTNPADAIAEFLIWVKGQEEWK
jgi:hypothetical protein